jgi:dipeptidyl aminopeptidase/acylaminoacyl peptidase
MVALVSHDETARDNPINQLLGDAPNLDGRCREASPIYHVSAKSPPFFLVHGMNDSVVPVEQTTKFAAKLKEAGVPVQTVYVNGADHLLLGLPGQVKPTLPEIDRMVLDFLQKWLWGIN